MLEAMQAHPHYSAPLPDENSGRGIATGFWRNNTGPSSAVAHVMADGSISLLEGSVDIGGTRTAIAQQFAEVMGIATEDVHPRVVDTDSIGYTSVTGGSGVTFKTGLAAYEAAWDVIHQLKERAALLWETESSQVEYVAGSLYHKLDDTLQISFKDLAAKLNELGGPIVGRASVNPRGVGASFSAMIVDVDVDPETGKVQILRCTAFQDAGIAIHPAYVEGQIQGGSVQGIGWALNEGYVMSSEGNLLNASLLDYRMPTSLDVPMIDAVIVEVPNPGHPFGVRGIGEASIVPPLAAVANAIHGATGVRLRDLPMSPGRVLEGIWKHEGKV
jgi:CO/xanthine dehydrogenase Mo-binding subunit